MYAKVATVAPGSTVLMGLQLWKKTFYLLQLSEVAEML